MKKDIRYVPTPLHIVNAMLDLGELKPNDFLIDLGSGDGRIPIQAALRGARARGVEIDDSLARRSQYNAMEAQVDHRVEFLVEDMFRAEISEATFLTLYLRHTVNAALQPKLQNELKPGTRVVSHSFCMVDWEPDQEIEVDTKLLFLWTVP
ncbi:MAG TPA: SAM-dependent methyltransferase [Phycisphaerales bacterium]|nr:SAM-dependent methyltransferase [Phycisphaerales bacterium]